MPLATVIKIPTGRLRLFKVSNQGRIQDSWRGGGGVLYEILMRDGASNSVL